MAVEPDVGAWARAVTATMHERGMSQRQLGEEVARLEGRTTVYAQGTIGDWLRMGPPKPQNAIAIEEALGATPGSLTQYLGFVPVEARPAVTFDEVVDREEGRLSGDVRRMLKLMFHAEP